MKQPEPSGESKGEKLFLKDILKYFDGFKIKEPIAWIVGGMANHGFSKNDIDILINISPSESDSSISKVIRFRIQRSLPKELWERIHWLYNDGVGPFTSNIPLFSLEAVRMPLHRREMSAASIRPLRFFKQLKAVSGRYKKDIFTIKALQEIIPKEAYPVEVNMKYDGMRVQLHKSGNEVVIFSEDGGGVTARFPAMVKQLRSHHDDIIIDAEVTGQEKGKHIGRSDVSGYAHTKGAPDDSRFIANVHDIVYHGEHGKDIHGLARSKRLDELEHLKIGNKFSIIPWRIAGNSNDLARHVGYFSKLPGSEGAMIKSLKSIYELDGLTSLWWKYKKDFVIDAKVIEVSKVARTDAFNYLCVIENDIPMGKTYNTKVKAEIGDILQVAFGNLNKYTDGNKIWYNWVFPRVIGLQENKSEPDDSVQADLLNKESGGFIEEKVFPSRYKSLISVEQLIENVENYNPKSVNNRVLLDDHRLAHVWASLILSGKQFKYSIDRVKRLHDSISREMQSRGFLHNTPIELSSDMRKELYSYRRFMNKEIDKDLFNTLDEYLLSKRKKRFVFQHHWRGKSVHGDMRFEAFGNGHLFGWTLLVEKSGEIKEPIENIDMARQVDSEDNFKIDYKTGEPKEQKIQVVQKGTQPLVWLTLEGAAKPGSIGATKEFPGVFHVIDKGLYEMAADKPFFKEYFIEGKIFKGRYIFRKLPATGNFKDAGKIPFVWFFWKPEEQTPYILTSRALRKQDFPIGDESRSWLPSEWELKIPEELRWWGKDLTREEATELIKEARLFLNKNNILSEKELDENKFILDRHWWKGQKVIRDLPVEHWDLRFSNYEFSLDNNPIFRPDSINAVYRKGHDVEDAMEINDDRIIPAGERGNPNKKIDAHVETLDSGRVNIVAHTEHFMSMELSGKQLKGFFTLKRVDEGSNQWLLTKGKLPSVMSLIYDRTLSELEIEQIIDLSDPQLRLSRGEICQLTGCCASTVYKWQKNSDLL